MRSLFPLTVYCISLVFLQRLLALPAKERPGGNRFDLIDQLFDLREDTTLATGGQNNKTVPNSGPSQPPKWSGFLRQLLVLKTRQTPPSLAWTQPTEDLGTLRRALRARRHANSGLRRGHHYPHHAQLMRVGCVLGTCQVQNLSHRLYQLIGQSGREDTSPINPRSPHSYG